MLSQQALNEINGEINKYPPDQKQAALMATLSIAQREIGHLSTGVMDWVAGFLNVPPIRVREVATFYSMYDLEPVGKHKVCVCSNVSCMLRGSDGVIQHIENRLGIKVGETTPDGEITLKEVECLGACGGAPMMQIGDDYHENLTPERIDAILDQLETANA
jgi:NADH-quinone oxidoreductase subunit E